MGRSEINYQRLSDDFANLVASTSADLHELALRRAVGSGAVRNGLPTPGQILDAYPEFATDPNSNLHKIVGGVDFAGFMRLNDEVRSFGNAPKLVADFAIRVGKRH